MEQIFYGDASIKLEKREEQKGPTSELRSQTSLERPSRSECKQRFHSLTLPEGVWLQAGQAISRNDTPTGAQRAPGADQC